MLAQAGVGRVALADIIRPAGERWQYDHDGRTPPTAVVDGTAAAKFRVQVPGADPGGGHVVDEADRKATARLGGLAITVAAEAEHLWGRSFTAEHEIHR